MVVSLAGAQQLQQRGFVGGQGRPGAAALLQQQRGGGGNVGVRTTQQQPAFRPVPRAQVQQRVTQQSINTQQRVAPLANPQVSPVAPNPIPQQQQQQAINVQQRTVQIPAAQPQQVSVNQQRPLQAIRLQQKPVAQRVVQIPAGSPKPVSFAQQRLAQTAIPQQQVIVAQQQDVQIPFAQHQQQFTSPITTNREFPQITPQEATLEDNVNTGFAQDSFRPQENAGVSQGILRQSPQPVQRKKVRKQKVKNINSNTGNFPRELTEDEQEDQREWEEILAEQARNAKYSYSSTVEDGLNDQLVSRQETRDGLLTTGSYSYSDGFFQRTIHYEADENGFRVTRQEIEAIGDGPQPDPNGSAHVTSEFGNARNEYAITAADLAPPAPPEESITGSI
ncbi:putative mediator of RNA polymerase II transcription subunit 12 [Ischnura elegans]|uniref:putative mediator of RNA polymerase II transcription subunit 12 n=1 Tax=Ischnura elegans TaxID=197161 RepID=UPI001ED88659|nr:putative mediator of RNA polymerase II transcription subunit 12 [Ischnura elegans]